MWEIGDFPISQLAVFCNLKNENRPRSNGGWGLEGRVRNLLGNILRVKIKQITNIEFRMSNIDAPGETSADKLNYHIFTLYRVSFFNVRHSFWYRWPVSAWLFNAGPHLTPVCSLWVTNGEVNTVTSEFSLPSQTKRADRVWTFTAACSYKCCTVFW